MLTNVIVLVTTLLSPQVSTHFPNHTDTIHQSSETIQQSQIQIDEDLTACGNSNTRQKGCGGTGRRFVAS